MIDLTENTAHGNENDIPKPKTTQASLLGWLNTEPEVVSLLFYWELFPNEIVQKVLWKVFYAFLFPSWNTMRPAISWIFFHFFSKFSAYPGKVFK